MAPCISRRKKRSSRKRAADQGAEDCPERKIVTQIVPPAPSLHFIPLGARRTPASPPGGCIMTIWLKYVAAVVLGAGAVSTASAQVPWLQPVPVRPTYPTSEWDSKAQIVTDWYREYLRRSPDQRGLYGWVDQLDRRWPEEVLSKILGSAEYIQLWGGRDDQFIRGLHVDVLGRQPSPGDIRSWLRRLDRRDSHSKVAREFLRDARGAGVRF